LLQALLYVLLQQVSHIGTLQYVLHCTLINIMIRQSEESGDGRLQLTRWQRLRQLGRVGQHVVQRATLAHQRREDKVDAILRVERLAARHFLVQAPEHDVAVDLSYDDILDLERDRAESHGIGGAPDASSIQDNRVHGRAVPLNDIHVVARKVPQRLRAVLRLELEIEFAVIGEAEDQVRCPRAHLHPRQLGWQSGDDRRQRYAEALEQVAAEGSGDELEDNVVALARDLLS